MAAKIIQMQQQNELSPIWAIDLFERREFRNGKAVAQCMECGQSFDTCELSEMTGHIVQKHAEYAAKLLAKQLEFDGHQKQKTVTKIELARPPMATESANETAKEKGDDGTISDDLLNISATPFSAISTSFSMSPYLTNETLQRIPSPTTPPFPCAEKEESDNCCFWSTEMAKEKCDGIGHNEDIVMAFSAALPEIENGTSSSADRKDCIEFIGGGNIKENAMSPLHPPYLDKYKKQWDWLFNLDNIDEDSEGIRHFCQTYFLSRKNIYPNRVSFVCRYTQRGKHRDAVPCPFRALYVRERRAMFAFQSHNHPPPEGKGTAKNEEAKGLFQTESQAQKDASAKNDNENNKRSCGSSTVASVSQFDSKGENKSAQIAEDNDQYLDCIGRPWNFLSKIDLGECDTNAKRRQLRDFCREHGLIRQYMKRHFDGTLRVCALACKDFRPISHKCPYRAIYVVERSAIFDRNLHNHSTGEREAPKKKKKKANSIFGRNPSSSFASPSSLPTLDHFLLRLSDHFSFTQKQQMPMPTQSFETENENSAADPSSNSNGLIVEKKDEDDDDYVDSHGKTWKLMTKIDIGECKTVAERRRMWKFCRENELIQYNVKRNANGLIRYDMVCRECFKNKIKCPFRAVYVAKRRAIFVRGCHDHTEKDSDQVRNLLSIPTFDQLSKSDDEKPKNDGNGNAMEINGLIVEENENDRCGEKDDDDFVDSHGKAWKLMTKIDLGECKTVAERQWIHQFSNEHGFQQCTARRNADGIYRYYMACREFRKSKFNCPFRAVYVAQRRAIFVRGCHDHTEKMTKMKQPKEKSAMAPNTKKWGKKGRTAEKFDVANAVVGPSADAANSSISATVIQKNADRLLNLLNIPTFDQLCKSADEKPKNDGNGNAMDTFDTENNKENAESVYVGKNGKVFKLLANLDVGECKTEDEKLRLRNFGREHNLHRISAKKWNANGTLRLLQLICIEKMRKFCKCPYQAVYVAERRAIFENGSHDHSMSTRKFPLKTHRSKQEQQFLARQKRLLAEK